MATNKRAVVLYNGQSQEVTSGDTLALDTMPVFYPDRTQFGGNGTSASDLFSIIILTTGGTTTAYTLTPSVALTAYVANTVIFVKFNAANTGAATLNISGLGTKPLVKNVNTALVSGDLVANRIYELFYDGTSYQVRGVQAETFGAASGVTATTGNSSTLLATTAFVAGQIQRDAVLIKTAAYTVLTTDFGKNGQLIIYANATTAAFIITLPTAATMGSTTLTYTLTVIKTDSTANSVTVKGNGSELINSANTDVLSTQYSTHSYKSNGTQIFII